MIETSISSPARERLQRLARRLGLKGTVVQLEAGYFIDGVADAFLGRSCRQARIKLHSLATPYKETSNAHV